jgi:hypothetical protein
MSRRFKLLIVVALLGGVGYGGYVYARYVRIRKDAVQRAARVVYPKQDETSVSEIGYVSSMRDEIFLRPDDRINLVWFVKIPSTGALYSCSYERGFPSFKVGDDVRIIRPKDVASDAGFGYIVGLHEQLNGKTALVWVIDEERLEMDK